MQCYVIILDTTGTTYTFYEIKEQKGTIKEKTKTKKTNRKRKGREMTERKIEVTRSCRSPRRQARCPTLEKERPEKKRKKIKSTTACKQSKGHSYGRAFFPNTSTFVSRFFSIFHIIRLFSHKYWNVNEVDIFGFGEFDE